MSKAQVNKKRKLKEGRLEIVAQLYKRGFSIRKIQAEVMKRLDLQTYSTGTVHRDVQTLLKEWRENRLADMDDAIQLELERIDDTVRELWEQWEKSKEDYIRTTEMKLGVPDRDKKQHDGSEGAARIKTTGINKQTTNIVGLGNTAYISEIRQQLAERRKLLGLYAPEKKDITGEMSFASYLIESGLIEEETEQST